jgi:hypothetical protein
VTQEEQGLLSPEKEAVLGDPNDGTAGSGGLAISLRMVGKVKLGQIRGLATSIDVKSVDSVETSPPTSRSLIDCQYMLVLIMKCRSSLLSSKLHLLVPDSIRPYL